MHRRVRSLPVTGLPMIFSPSSNDTSPAAAVAQPRYEFSPMLMVAAGVTGAVFLFVLVITIIVWRCKAKDKSLKEDTRPTTVLKQIQLMPRGDTRLSLKGDKNKPFYYSPTTPSSDDSDLRRMSLSRLSLTDDAPPKYSSIHHVQPRAPLSEPTYYGPPMTASFRYQQSYPTEHSSSKTSDDEEPDDKDLNATGRIWFSVNYDEEKKKLNVHVIRARYNKARGMGYESGEPFVRIYLLPDETNFQQSSFRKKTFSPRFNETFSFEVSKEDCTNRTLRLSVYDVDRRNVRHSLGHVLIPVNQIDITKNEVFSKTLEKHSQNVSFVGELFVSLCCNPYTERIKVTVMRAKNLVIKSYDRDQSELFVRLELSHGRKTMKSKQTSSQTLCSEVVFFQSYSFGISGRRLDTCSVTLTLFVRQPQGVEIPFGRVVLGSFLFAHGEAQSHWEEMLANPRTTIEKWHNLEPVTT